MTNSTPMPALPEPDFRLSWSSHMYRVSKPNIEAADCYTADQMHQYAESAIAALGSSAPSQETEDWKSPADKELMAFINATPLAQSLLYDLNLLPEQITTEKGWSRMAIICDHFRAALGSSMPSGEALTVDAIMEQAQVFASAWSLLGGPFDSGDGLETAEREKAELRSMIAALATQPTAAVEPAFHPNVEWASGYNAGRRDANHDAHFEAAAVQGGLTEAQAALIELGTEMVNITTTVRGIEEWPAIPAMWLDCMRERDEARAALSANAGSQQGEARFWNLVLDIRRVIGWEKPLNDFEVVGELQEYIQSLATPKEAGSQPTADDVLDYMTTYPSQPTAAGAVPTDERAAFEAWRASVLHVPRSISPIKAWFARAALAAPADGSQPAQQGAAP